VTLTDAGRALLTEARRTLVAAAAARAAVDGVQAVQRGSLAVGGVPTFDLLDQPGLLQRFRARHPGVEIRYFRSTSTALINEVREGRINIAFVSVPAGSPAGIRVIELAVEPVMFLCRQDHPLAQRREVTFDEMAGEAFVGGPPGSGGYEAIDRIFAASGTERTVPYEVNDVAAMLDFVEQGLGVTLAFEALAVNRPNLRASPLAETSMVWRLGAITPPEEQTTPAARQLLSLLG
jgi:DNA-binding transcriptional LysR family regulator